MKCLERNKVPFHYALFKEKIPIKDEYGNETGEYRVVYEEPVLMKANVSSATGEAQVEQFGNSITYDKVVISDDINSPINENTVLCVDVSPTFDEDGNLLYDYVIKKVAKSLNTISYAISKVADYD